MHGGNDFRPQCPYELASRARQEDQLIAPSVWIGLAHNLFTERARPSSLQIKGQLCPYNLWISFRVSWRVNVIYAKIDWLYAQALYPNIPVELVVSIGTGLNTKYTNASTLGWDVLVNQLIASSTDTEDVHSLLLNFLPPDKYFRLNPYLQDSMAIDERNKTQLEYLKKLAKQTWQDIDAGPDAKRFEQLIKALKGTSK